MLLEQDTKTHPVTVVEVPASVVAELRRHVELRDGSEPGAFVFATPFGDPARLSTAGTGSGIPSQLSSAAPSGRRCECSVTRQRACSPRAACP